MVAFTFPSLNENQGTDTADGLRNVANTAANAICSLWANYAGATADLPDPTGIGKFNNGLFSGLCKPRGIQPPPPQAPFSGGQCEINYRVEVRYGSARPQGSPSTFPANDGTVYPSLPGPIRGTAIIGALGGEGKQGVIQVRTTPDYPDGQQTVWVGGSAGRENRFEGAFLQIVSVTPTDPNIPDTCGDPEPSYPPVVPPKGDFEFDVDVDLGGFSLRLPLSINPIQFNPQILIRPELNVNIGPFNIYFSPDGVDVFLPPTLNPPISLPPGSDPRIPPPAPRPPSGGGSRDCPPCICPEVDLTPVINLLEDVKECTCDPRKVIEGSISNTRGSLVRVLGSLTKVIIIVSELSRSVRQQKGEGGAPNILYLGWFAWGVDDRLSERVPLSFGENVFLIDSKDCNTFGFSLNFGSRANVFYEFRGDT